jgi:hypothetical protein
MSLAGIGMEDSRVLSRVRFYAVCKKLFSCSHDVDCLQMSTAIVCCKCGALQLLNLDGYEQLPRVNGTLVRCTGISDFLLRFSGDYPTKLPLISGRSECGLTYMHQISDLRVRG